LELLSDVLLLRHTILNTLDATTLEALERQDEIYIALVAAGGYEYTVAMLAVLALGAAVIPLAPALPVAELVYFVEKSRAVLVLASSLDFSKCRDLEKRITTTSNEHFRAVAIGPCTLTPVLNSADIVISSDRPLDESAPSVVIFTSGTTGPPKGAVMPRSYVFDCALAVADHYRLTDDDTLLHVLPVHHATGVGVGFFPFLISGSRIEFRSGSFDEAWTWERWREGATNRMRRISFFSGVPTIFMRMRVCQSRTQHTSRNANRFRGTTNVSLLDSLQRNLQPTLQGLANSEPVSVAHRPCLSH
jgi:malonyl-CoA/methylmalonyl-CoA synthetase